MKKINMDSSTYKLVKGGFGFVGALGSMICLDSVALTFVRALFPRSKFINSVAMVGCIGLNAVIGAIGQGGTEFVVDEYAQGWNALADFVNGEEPENDIPEKKPIPAPSRNSTSEEDKQYVSDVILKAEPFSFKTEEEAKEAFEGLKKTVDVMGFANLPWYAKIANKDLGVKPGSEGYDILSTYGWKTKDLERAGIDKIRDDEYILDVFTYHDISDVFVVTKED